MFWKKRIRSWLLKNPRINTAFRVVGDFLQRRGSEFRAFHLPRILSLIFGCLGILALILSLKSSWFSVPVPAVTEGYQNFQVEQLESSATRVFKLGLASLLILNIGLNLTGVLKRKGTVFLLTLQTLYLIAFPCALLYLSPAEVTRAAWLSVEHESISWLGGDVFTTQEKTFSGFESDILLIDTPRDIGAVFIPKSIPNLLNFGNFHMLAEYLGFSDGFAQFSHKGWHMALWGTILLTSMLIRRPEGIYLPALQTAFNTFIIGIVLQSIVCLFPVFLSAQYISKTHQRILESRYDRALDSLETACQLLPPISYTSAYLLQKSLLHSRLKLETRETRYFRATLLEKNGFHLQALHLYKDLLREESLFSPLGRACIRALIRAAVYKINSAKYETARRLLNDVLNQDFLHPQAVHSLQVALIKTRDLKRIYPLYLLMKEIYGRWNIRSKKTVIAMSRQHAIQAAYLRNDLSLLMKLRVMR